MLAAVMAAVSVAFAPDMAVAEEPDAPAFPLSVGSGDRLEVGDLYDLEVKRFPFKITNISGQDAVFAGLRMNCNCMTVAKEERGAVIKPGQSIEAVVDIDPTKLKMGIRKLDRILYVEAEGFDAPLRVAVLGDIHPSVAVEPAEVIDVQEFAGLDIPWERTFTITNANPNIKDDDFILEAPGGTRFNTQFRRVSPGKYELKVSPKLPMSKEQIFEIFAMPLQGGHEGMVVRTGITGTPKGYMLSAPGRAFPYREKLRQGEEVVMEFPLAFAVPRPNAKAKKHKWSMKTVVMPAAVDEKAHIDRDPAAFMAGLQKGVAFNTPPDCRAQLVGGDNELSLKITFLPEFAKQVTPTPVEMLYGGRVLCSIPTGVAIRESTPRPMRRHKFWEKAE